MRFALAGNPNTGKTTLFNELTGSTARVGNWPGVTVDRKTGVYKKLDEAIDIIDLPGIYSLSPYTPEEIVSRNYIIDEKPDCVINIVDATNLERNLYLTTQLLEIDVPIVIALNMIDMVKKDGSIIKTESLAKKLGVDVVEISALRGENIDKLMEVALVASKKGRKAYSVLDLEQFSSVYKDVLNDFKANNIDNPLFHSIKLIEGDEYEVSLHPELVEKVEELKKPYQDNEFNGDFEGMVADARYRYISNTFAEDIIKAENKEDESKSDRIDKVLTHRIWSIPIFLLIMFLIFHITFSEDFLGLNKIFKVEFESPAFIDVATGMGYDGMLQEATDEWITHVEEDDNVEAEENAYYMYLSGLYMTLSEEEKAEVGKFNEFVAAYQKDSAKDDAIRDYIAPTLEGLPSPGIFLQSWMGFVTGGLIDIVDGWMSEAPDWLHGLICDGLLTGLDSIFSFLPQILMLIFFIAILEDCGYMARVAFIMDRAFRKFGLSGKSFIPLLMGFGCSVPAMMAARTIEDQDERDRTIRLAPFFSCGAKAPIWSMLALVVAGKFLGDIFVFSIYLLGIAIAIVIAILARVFGKQKEVSPFIMELPAYHLPQFKNLMAHLWDKFKHFLYKASTIITGAIVLIWFLSNFGWAFWQGMVDIENSILASLGRILRVVFYPLGFAMGEDGWKYSVATITGLIAKEDVVATMATLGLVEGTINISNSAIYAFALYNLLTLPCFASVATAKAESSKKGFVVTILSWLGISYVIALLTYWLGTLIEVIPVVGILVVLLLIAAVVAVSIYVSKKKVVVRQA